MWVKQGDQYFIPITIKNNNQPLDIENVEKVEFTIGQVTRVYPLDVSYVNGEFLFPLTQRETFAFNAGAVKLDVRVKFVGGNVIGIKKIESIDVPPALSREVI